MVEADRIPAYQMQKPSSTSSEFGYEEVKDNFSEGAWKDVSVGDGVYGAPIDGGPMGMIYRKDIFDKYGITPPTTWAEYEAAAQKVKDAGGPSFGDFPANQPAYATALLSQNGSQPFTYEPGDGGKIGIDLNSDFSKKVLELLGRAHLEGPGRHGGPVHSRVHRRCDRRRLRDVPVGRMGSWLPAGCWCW